jgi:peptidoglycan-associated lipoprotein
MIAVLIGCGKKVQVTNVPAPPSVLRPVVSIKADASSIQAGQSVLLTWETQNASQVRIEPLGPVDPRGTRIVRPLESVTYKLVAKGPGGEQAASVDIKVSRTAAAKDLAAEEVFGSSSGRQDIFFETDAYTVPEDQELTIRNDADFLKKHPDLRIVVEGHCDELGSTEYNLALGANRAAEVKALLVKAGVDGNRIATISYGKERPFCTESSEGCFKQNRRAHLVPNMER